jgi:hypothetical protein
MLNYNRFRGLRGNSVIPSVILRPTHWISNGGVGGAIRNLVTQVSLFVILINLININTVNALENKRTYQMEYLKQLDQSPDQYTCLTSLITMENSRWDIRAKNGSHHGLPQGRSKFLATADYKAQITWHIKYIKHRYGTDRFGVANACGAWSHWLMKGWH